MAKRIKRLAILHSRTAARGGRHHMVSLIAEDLAAQGIEVVHLYDTRNYVPADALFVHVDLSRVPARVQHFAERYPLHINAAARDIRKRTFADGLLSKGDSYDAPVIVKSDLNYGGIPEYEAQSLATRALAKTFRLITRSPSVRILSKEDYQIFLSLEDVPEGYFGPGNVVQKMFLEKDGGKNVLREYMFLGSLHYENIERSDTEIITEDEHVSCLPFTPHPRLIEVRRRLKLDYGKIDYVMVDGTPFIFDANKTMGLGGKTGEAFGPGLRQMLRAFAGEIRRVLHDADSASFTLAGGAGAAAEQTSRSVQSPHPAR